MMNLLPKREPRSEPDEPLVSRMCGVLAFTIGVLASYILLVHVSEPTWGPKDGLVRREAVRVTEPSTTGIVTRTETVDRLIPSMELLGMLCVGGCLSGLGIYVSRRRSPDCRIFVSAAGLIACVLAFVLAWILLAVAAAT